MKGILKISFATLLSLVFCSQTVNAQSGQLVQVGIKGGANYSWMNLDDTEDEEGKIGFHAGILARVNLSEHFAVQGEALYSETGTKVTYNNLLFDGYTQLCLKYIDVPVLLVIKLNDNINIQAGPYYSFLLDANAKNDATLNIFDFEEQVDSDFFKNYDYGIAAGMGLEVSHVHGGFRYCHGLQKIEREKEVNGVNYTFSDANNTMFQLFIGFVF